MIKNDHSACWNEVSVYCRKDGCTVNKKWCTNLQIEYYTHTPMNCRSRAHKLDTTSARNQENLIRERKLKLQCGTHTCGREAHNPHTCAKINALIWR